MRDKQIELNIPKGVRAGQHLRLTGQGGPGSGDAPAGDLYLEIEIAPHPRFRVDGRDVLLDLPLAPWEAALGARITVTTPDGSVELAVPAGSASGRRLRLRGKGLPSVPPGDLFVVLVLVLPPADTEPARAAYQALAQAFADFKPRSTPET
jgi:curved DNA-binding protein